MRITQPLTPLHATAPATSRGPLGPTATRTERRTRARLRELCDEVLASYRVASNRDLFSDDDRQLAQTLTRRLLATEN